jgi:hypothetical protein
LYSLFEVLIFENQIVPPEVASQAYHGLGIVSLNGLMPILNG